VIAERYSIVGDDPLSAHASLAWTIRREGADWHIRVEARIDMRCTVDAFLVQQSLAAYEDDEPVFAQVWDDRIARDLA
jgi:hypothetical protein